MENKFNKYFKKFLTFLSSSANLEVNEREENYSKIYVKNILPYMEEISLRNIDFFTYKDLCLLEDVTYKKLFLNINRSNMDNLWKNLQSLYIRASSLLNLEELIKSLDEELQNKCNNVINQHSNILLNFVNEQQTTVPAKEALKRTKKKKKKNKNTKNI